METGCNGVSSEPTASGRGARYVPRLSALAHATIIIIINNNIIIIIIRLLLLLLLLLLWRPGVGRGAPREGSGTISTYLPYSTLSANSVK